MGSSPHSIPHRQADLIEDQLENIMAEENGINGLPKQASLAECLAMSRKHDQQMRNESAFLEAEQARAKADAQRALARLREEGASVAPGGAVSPDPEETGKPGGKAAQGGKDKPQGVDWKPYSDEQLVGMAAAAGIEKSVHEGNREMIILALEEKGFKPQE